MPVSDSLETERLMLRPFRLTDVDALMGVFGDADVMRFGDGTQTRDWVEGWVRDQVALFEDSTAAGVFAVVERASGRIAGYCGLQFYPDVNGQPEWEIGFRLAVAFQGQGYATEAAMAVRDFSFQKRGVDTLIALIDPDNAPSIRVAEKIGMTYVRDALLEGYSHSDRVYVVNRPGRR